MRLQAGTASHAVAMADRHVSFKFTRHADNLRVMDAFVVRYDAEAQRELPVHVTSYKLQVTSYKLQVTSAAAAPAPCVAPPRPTRTQSWGSGRSRCCPCSSPGQLVTCNL